MNRSAIATCLFRKTWSRPDFEVTNREHEYYERLLSGSVFSIERIAANDGSITVTVLIRIKRRGLCKTVTLPNGDNVLTRPWDNTPTPLQLALACGHRWLGMLESGEVRSMKEIARRDGFDDSYVSRMVNLTTLAPDLVAAILDETLPPEVTLFTLASGRRCCGRSSGGWL